MCLGIPGQLVDLTHIGEHRGTIEVDGVRREVNLALVLDETGGVAIGDWVLVHVGFAMAKIDAEEAARALAFIKELGAVYDEEIDQLTQIPATD
ncbi:MAG: HypC/HybG/HupF family hydrogenase formation chaperone [Acidimicrobiales bacterium]